MIYHLSARRPASRYIYNVPQRTAWAKAESRQTLIQELATAPPAAIVVVHRDSLPWVTGSPLDSAAALRTFPELRLLLQNDYREARRIGDLQILLRHDSPGPGAGSR